MAAARANVPSYVASGFGAEMPSFPLPDGLK
jgi:hypothetical protein